MVKKGSIMKKIISAITLAIILMSTAFSAYALPSPKTAHYPRSGMVSLSPSNKSTNTYAFKADSKTDSKLLLRLNDAYAEECQATIKMQVFVVNKWGNWIAFGEPRYLELSCTPESYEEVFVIREKKPFCLVISAPGTSGECVIPYDVQTCS